MEADPKRLDRPEKVGPYRIQELAGRGGMGAVWRAWDDRLRRPVAIKQLRHDASALGLRERLRREARAAARLNHPAIVHIYDLIEHEGADWIVMELVEGSMLRDLVRTQGPVCIPQAIELGREIAEGLAEAHAHGILHRDLKASNVMVTPAGRAKILDFGLAKSLVQEGTTGQEETLSTPGAILGTCYAMSPEQARGHALDARSDLFSLGALLYEILTGEPPFRGETPPASLARVLTFQPGPLAEVRPGVPPELSTVVARLLEKDPLLRPRSAREVVCLLAALTRSADGGSTMVEMVEIHPPVSSRQKPSAGHERSLGERRLLTLVCCGLTGLKTEQGPLDLEVLSEAMDSFQELTGEICRRFSGHPGGTLGPHLWFCFGYPLAREDDVQRAVQAAWELALQAGKPGFQRRWRAALRIAVHSGPALVVNRPGQGEARLELGATLDMVMGLQDTAPAGEVVVSAAGQPLARGFTLEPLPPVLLPGAEAPVIRYRVLGVAGPREESGPGQLTPLVGRERELELLVHRFRLACSGTGQAVMVSGEPGIGKSRLVKALREHVAAEAPVWWIAYGSLATQSVPLAPVIDLLERALFHPETADPGRKLAELEKVLGRYGLTELLPVLAALLSLPAQRPALGPDALRQKTFEALLALLAATAERRPLVLIGEDLHWLDPSSLELLGLLLDQIPALPLMLLVTFRPELQAPWRHRAEVTQLGLSRLSDEETTLLIDRLAGGEALPEPVRRRIQEKTDGVPLFIEEMTRALLEAGPAEEGPGIPATLGSSLAARLDRLGPAREVALIASVAGRTFSFDLLAAVAPLDAAVVRQGLDELVRAGLVHRRGVGPRARYSFKHALLQDAAYGSLLNRDRQALHLKIAQALEAATSNAGLLAHHWSQAVDLRDPDPELVRRAGQHLLAAGERTYRLGAYREAQALLDTALKLVRALPESSERDGQEMVLLLPLCKALQATEGPIAPAVQALRKLMRERLRRDPGSISHGLYEIWCNHLFRGEYEDALTFAEAWLERTRGSRAALAAAHCVGHTLYWLGRLPECLYHAESVLASFLVEGEEEPMGHGDPRLAGFPSAWALAHMGMEEEAAGRLDLTVDLCKRLGDAFINAMAASSSTKFHLIMNDAPAVLAGARRLGELARESGIVQYQRLAETFHARALAELGAAPDVVDQTLATAEQRFQTFGALAKAGFCNGTAAICLRAGLLEEAGDWISRGLAVARAGELVSEASLLYLSGELHLERARRQDSAGHRRRAEDDLRRAFDVACRRLQARLAQQALSLLTPLLEAQARHAQAEALLARLAVLREEIAEKVRSIFAETGAPLSGRSRR